MEHTRRIATFCVGRAVFFGAIAISCMMLAFSFNPALAFRCGAITTMLMAGVLTFKAIQALSRHPRKTEVWLYLDERTRPANDQARAVFSRMMREVYGRFARGSFMVACGFFAISLGFSAVGFQPYDFRAPESLATARSR